MVPSSRRISWGAIWLLVGLWATACALAQVPTAPPPSTERGEETSKSSELDRSTRACDAGNATGCFHLAALLEQGRGVEKDEARAATLFEKACDGGEAAGCFKLAVLFEEGRGVQRDGASAGRLLRKACDLDHGAACFKLGARLDTVVAMDVFLKACDLGSAAGCVSLGVIMGEGRYGVKDDAQAAALFAKGCDGGDVTGCFQLGVLLEGGRGVAKDEARAMALYAKACDEKNASGCFMLSDALAEGRGVAKDEARAMALRKKACDGGDARGCAKLYTDACERGDALSCLRLGHLFDEGSGVKQDRARALDLYVKACKGGQAAGCTPEKVKTRYSLILSALGGRNFASCRGPSPSDAVRTTTNGVRTYAGAPASTDLDLNVIWEPRWMISPLFKDYSTSTGGSRIEYGRMLLEAPMTLVLDVESTVSPRVIMEPTVSFTQTSDTIHLVPGQGIFFAGALTVRQVRFDPAGKAMCATRVTVKNSDLTLHRGESTFEAARKQLLEQIPLTF